MRGLRRISWSPRALLRRAVGALGVAALVVPLLATALHAPAWKAPSSGAGGAAVAVSAPGAAASQPAHAHGDACPLCRAASQLRVGLRVPSSAGAFVALAPVLRLERLDAALAPAAPALDRARSRAPPAA